MSPAVLSSGLRRTLIQSMVGHSIVAIFVLASGAWHIRTENQSPKHVITTKLVRLGKKRPKELLPRVQKTKSAPKKAVNVTQPTTATKPVPIQNAAGALQRAKNLTATSRALERIKSMRNKQDTGEGHPDGVVDGDVSDAALALMGNHYATKIRDCLNQYYAIEGVNKTKVTGRQATLLLRIDAKGKFIDWRMLKSSGHTAVDRATIRAIKRCGKIAKPPAELRRTLVQDGIEIVFKP